MEAEAAKVADDITAPSAPQRGRITDRRAALHTHVATG